MMRIGMGYDSHRFCEGDYVKLGGIVISCDVGIQAHSDGDVVLHALVDAILGALALGDIGQHFPDTDPQYKNASSEIFLKHCHHLLNENRYDIVNIDTTVIAEKPKIKPYVFAMRKYIAETLSISLTHVSVKATTNEKMGWIGRAEGLAAFAVVSLNSVKSKTPTC